jgi:hypothetical protein
MKSAVQTVRLPTPVEIPPEEFVRMLLEDPDEAMLVMGRAKRYARLYRNFADMRRQIWKGEL